MPRFFIEMLTDPGDLVVDPFAGSNVTGQVAESLKRRWLAVEIDRDYLEGSAVRFDDLQFETCGQPRRAARRSRRNQAIAIAALRGRGAEMSNVVPLRYVARAGLLPELTRQTYDSLYKALREVILNSVDAGATRVVVDLSAVETADARDHRRRTGMTLDELQQSFMSLGGSQKFGRSDKFGRIGIGSLALMHYAQRVEIETTKAGSRSVTKA